MGSSVADLRASHPRVGGMPADNMSLPSLGGGAPNVREIEKPKTAIPTKRRMLQT